MPKNNEILFEVNRDFATRFAAEHYKSNGYGSHFHRNLEIYGVVDGEVAVSIAGEKRVLTKGQIGVINCMEIHEYFAQKQADSSICISARRICPRLYRCTSTACCRAGCSMRSTIRSYTNR